MAIETIETYDGDGNLIETQQVEVSEEQLLERKLSATGLPLSPEEYTTVRSEMEPLRALAQLSQSEFMALTANQRDRMTYDALKATRTVLRLLFRDDS